MHTATLITKVLEEQEKIDSTKPANRARVLPAAQRAARIVHSDRDWSYKYGEIVLEWSADDDPVVPDDFLNIGPSGIVWLDAPQRELTWCSLHLYNRLVKVQGRTGAPERYTMSSTSDGGARTVKTYPGANTPYTGGMIYARRAPVLVDDDEASQLEIIPVEWHDLVYEWTVLFMMKDKGNAQSQSEQKEVVNLLTKAMRTNERQGQEAVHRLIPYGR